MKPAPRLQLSGTTFPLNPYKPAGAFLHPPLWRAGRCSFALCVQRALKKMSFLLHVPLTSKLNSILCLYRGIAIDGIACRPLLATTDELASFLIWLDPSWPRLNFAICSRNRPLSFASVVRSLVRAKHRSRWQTADRHRCIQPSNIHVRSGGPDRFERPPRNDTILSQLFLASSNEQHWSAGTIFVKHHLVPGRRSH